MAERGDPLALRIVEALKTRMEEVRKNPNGDYHTDVGQAITLGRPNELVENIPASFVFSSEERSDTAKQTGLFPNSLFVHIEVHDQWGQDGDNREPERIAQLMIADVKRAVFDNNDRTFKTEAGDALASRVVYIGRVIGYAEDGSRIVSSRVDFKIDYREVAGKPETRG